MTALTILFLLTVKHALCDLYLQSFLTLNKSHYTGGWPHYLQHAIGTLIVFVWFVDPVTAVMLATIDGVVHWHIDWFKHRVLIHYQHRTGMKMETQARDWYWCVQAVDQILHFATYYILAVIWLGHN